jgi:AcrR family transcriptional regulator
MVHITTLTLNHMVQKKSTAARGRPTTYVIDDVVAQALPVFWESGLDGASVHALEQATGLNRSSLYTSLDGKAGLYDRCLRQYVETATSWALTPAIEGTAGLDDLVGLIDRIGTMTADAGHPPGCFAVRSRMREEGEPETARYLAALRAAIAGPLTRAEAVDGLDASQREIRILVIEAALTGMLALGSRGTADPHVQARSLAAGARSWVDHDRARGPR